MTSKLQPCRRPRLTRWFHCTVCKRVRVASACTNSEAVSLRCSQSCLSSKRNQPANSLSSDRDRHAHLQSRLMASKSRAGSAGGEAWYRQTSSHLQSCMAYSLARRLRLLCERRVHYQRSLSSKCTAKCLWRLSFRWRCRLALLLYDRQANRAGNAQDRSVSLRGCRSLVDSHRCGLPCTKNQRDICVNEQRDSIQRHAQRPNACTVRTMQTG